MPERIQLSRRKGWKLPADAVNVARPTRWGNPFKVDPLRASWAHSDSEGAERFACPTVEIAVACYRSRLFSDAFASDLRIAIQCLRGHDLACWCKPGEPCHADLLLEVVNDPRATPLTKVEKGQRVVVMGTICTVDGPDSLGWGSFEFTGEGCGGVWHHGMGPVYAPSVLDLCAGKPSQNSPRVEGA